MHVVFRFDVKNANINDPNFETVKDEKIPDVVSSEKLMLKFLCLIRLLHSLSDEPVIIDRISSASAAESPSGVNSNLQLH